MRNRESGQQKIFPGREQTSVQLSNIVKGLVLCVDGKFAEFSSSLALYRLSCVYTYISFEAAPREVFAFLRNPTGTESDSVVRHRTQIEQVSYLKLCHYL